MLRVGGPKEISEREAQGEIERVYHEIRQTLRVTGVNLNFRIWADFGDFFPVLWDALRSNLETRAFEDASDGVRRAAVRSAEGLDRVSAHGRVSLGESQAYQIRAALDLYHYINPKLLVLTSLVRLGLDGEPVGAESNHETIELIERGVPARMYAMEMIAEEPEDDRLRDLFRDIKRTLVLESMHSDFRTLALWPDYLEAAWSALEPLVETDEFRAAAEGLSATSRDLARTLPCRYALDSEAIERVGQDATVFAETVDSFLTHLPDLVLAIALLQLDWRTPSEAVQSPFPPARRCLLGG